MRHPLSDWRDALLLHRDSVAWLFALDHGGCGRHLFCRHWWTEQLYPVGNGFMETSWYWSSLCDGHGACCGHSAESDAWLAHLGLFQRTV